MNKSVFSTNAYSSSLAGVSTPLRRGWTLHLEALRNKLLTDLNPENIFLFGNTGLGLNSQLAANNQWSVFLRISKQIHWGKGLPEGSTMEEYTAAHAPLIGSVRGLVLEQSIAGSRPAPNVAVSLDHYRSVVTDANGHYDFGSVPEGTHEVGLDMEQLPTDYEPGASHPRARERRPESRRPGGLQCSPPGHVLRERSWPPQARRSRTSSSA